MSKPRRRRLGKFFFSRQQQPDIDISSLMRATPKVDSVDGADNNFTSIESQITAVSRRYSGLEPLGGSLTRAIIDARVGFIVSDGLSVACDDPATREWAESFLDDNRFLTGGLSNVVRDGEIFGFSAMRLFRQPDRRVYVVPVPQKTLPKIKIRYKEFGNWESNIPDGFSYPIGNEDWEEVTDDFSVIVQPSGGREYPTRVGSIVAYIDNYDRCLYDIRRNNHFSARATPTFHVENAADAIQLRNQLTADNWEIGRSYVGNADFSYVSPEVSATNNLVQEARIIIETIAGTTGVPVHWLGHAEVMNNRATAETLYDSIKNATAADRVAWSEGIELLLFKARKLYSEGNLAGLNMEAKIDVKLPLVSFSDFRDRVSALSMAYSDDAISLDDYRNLLPGIDPLRTAETVQNEARDSFTGRERVIVEENE